MKKTKIIAFFYPTIFLFSLFFSNSLINLYYVSTMSPDFNRYKTYLDYFFIENSKIYSEQGVLYYFIISIFIWLGLNSYSNVIFNNFDELGKINNLTYISEFELIISNSIQNGNFFLYIIGITGIFKLLKFEKIDKKNIYLILTLLNLFPPVLQLRMTFKPEILAFSLLPWVILCLNKYIKNRSRTDLIFLTLTVSLTLVIKASITGMLLILYFLFFIKYFNKFSKRELFLLFALIIFFTSYLYIENVNIINRNLFERSDLIEIYNQKEYDNTADPRIFININFIDLLKNPHKNFHSDSLIGITLLDTYGDYFNEYWNKDYTLFNSSRKIFIESDQNLGIDLNQRVVYLPKFRFDLNTIRRNVALLLGIIFYYFLYKSIKNNQTSKIILLLPFIGVFVLALNSLGFPQNNFYPETADTFKSFYYSFLISFSFVEVVKFYLNSNLKFKKVKLSIYIILVFFILGFPKANNTQFDYTISRINTYSLNCEINKAYLKISLLENFELKCENFELLELQKEKFQIVSIPKANRNIVLGMIILFIKESKLFRYFLKTLNKFQKNIVSKF